MHRHVNTHTHACTVHTSIYMQLVCVPLHTHHRSKHVHKLTVGATTTLSPVLEAAVGMQTAQGVHH